MKNHSLTLLAFGFGLFGGLFGCSTATPVNPTDTSNAKPISNPFANYRGGSSVEESQDYSTTVSPVGLSSLRQPAATPSLDELTPPARMPDRTPSLSDREITHSFNQAELATPEAARQREIENGLGLVPADDPTPARDTSYLAQIDYVKTLYRSARYEAALLETDSLIQSYPTDPRLHEMRGTLLERLGHMDLAVRSWTQALRLDPANESLRRFVQSKRGLASQ
jgi:tetratricopeptide (TPR) repeat protein